MLAFATAASLWRRRMTGDVARVDCSMIEAILWTLAGPLLATQTGAPAEPAGNRSDRHAPHGAWRCAGDDAWISIAIRNDTDWRALCRLVPALAPWTELDFAARSAHETDIDGALTVWAATQDAMEAARLLRRCGIPAAALADSVRPRGRPAYARARLLGRTRHGCAARPPLARQLRTRHRSRTGARGRHRGHTERNQNREDTMTQRTDRIAKILSQGNVPGVAVAAVFPDGEVVNAAAGVRDIATGAAMSPDSVVWIASMTKAITAAAAMQQVEQGRLSLDAPIAGVLPQLANLQVLEGFRCRWATEIAAGPCGGHAAAFADAQFRLRL